MAVPAGGRRRALRAAAAGALAAVAGTLAGGCAAGRAASGAVPPALPPSAAGPQPAAGPGSPAASGAAGSSNGIARTGETARRRVGLALGGGAARGFAHVGVVLALERAGWTVDVVAGTSAGSLVGALYASGMDGARLRAAALSFDEQVLGDWSVGSRSLIAGRALQDLVNRHVGGRPIERFAKPFAAVATDLYNGRKVVFRTGDAGLAVRASSAVPGVFEPVALGGREYVDGGLVSPVPVRTCRELGAQFVIAVDISAQPQFQETGSMAQVLLQTFAIMGRSIASHELAEAQLVVRPPIGDLGSAAFEARVRAIEEGERAMASALAKLARP